MNTGKYRRPTRKCRTFNFKSKINESKCNYVTGIEGF